jgi:hypothetical protein
LYSGVSGWNPETLTLRGIASIATGTGSRLRLQRFRNGDFGNHTVKMYDLCGFDDDDDDLET